MKHNKNELPFRIALTWIVSSIFFVTCPFFTAFKWYLRYQQTKEASAPSVIRCIVQTGPQREALTSNCLAEILDLSIDCLCPIKDFNLEKAREKLLQFPLISNVKVELISKDSLLIDYTIRQPVAYLQDYENTTIDRNGYLFPFSPFFSPKHLPTISIGMELDPIHFWKKPLSGPVFDLILNLLELLKDPHFKDCFSVQRIDIANAFQESFGRKEIVLVIEERIYKLIDQRQTSYTLPCVLRLSTKNYVQELSNYLKLRPQLLEESTRQLSIASNPPHTLRLPSKTIDLRLTKLAFY